MLVNEEVLHHQNRSLGGVWENQTQPQQPSPGRPLHAVHTLKWDDSPSSKQLSGISMRISQCGCAAGFGTDSMPVLPMQIQKVFTTVKVSKTPGL